MMMISEPADFFSKGCGRCGRFGTNNCSTRLWTDGLNQVRQICADLGLIETVKWAHPCYMHAGRNIALLAAFRTDFRLNFMNPGLLTDTEEVLKRQGPHTQTPGMLQFTAVEQVSALEPVIQAYLRQLMEHAEAGTPPPKTFRQVEMPIELIEALDADPQLAEAFEALTPGRQKSYMFNINLAKQSATRVARIKKYRAKIIAGKGAVER